ncbi:MAG TPA: serine/threonine-protein kinase [Polyangiaceae bacterium]|nr:serine/threonine-protein kinase [Polyangiaceae bacterium]
MERDVQVGQLIAGKYRIQQMLGRGGMGVVMAALHEHLNQRVALKFLTDDAYQQPEAVTRFLREARSAVQIQSEHVARVMDVGTLDSGAPYIVMEYLRGLDLKDVSTRRGPLPVSEAVDFVLQACDAVAEAHALGIVHRDLKPSNLFLTERPDGSPLVKVLDFGISKALHGGSGGQTSQQQMTASAAIMGSPQYMSPEQIRSSKNVDARADVWALGTILHELIAGTPAYVADTVPGLLAMIVADPPPPLSHARPDAPADLEAAILRCLQKDREQRFANVAELAHALERFASPEVRPLVRRISRVLGAAVPDARDLRTSGPSAMTTRDVGVQTHNTWARTGRLSEGAAAPFYARPTVQLGAGMGLVGVALVAWLLLSRSSVTEGPVASPVPSTSTTSPTTTSPTKPVVKPAASPLPTPARDATTTPPATSGGIRPLRDVTPTPVEPRAADDAPPADDDDPRAARNFQDDATAYPSANAKKKDLAAAARKPKPRLAASKPTKPMTVDHEPERTVAAPPPPSAKKSDTLDDLFNDTK